MSNGGFIGNPNPPTPAFTSSHDWIKYYLVVHRLSTPSYRYAYYLWIFFALCFVVLSCFRAARSTSFGVYCHKWAIRRASFPKRKAKSVKSVKRALQYSVPVFNSPPPPVNVRLSGSLVNAQVLALILFFVVVVLASYLGPDYIKPSVNPFDLSRSKRSIPEILNDFPADLLSHIQPRDYQYAPATPPEYTIYKAWWTAGGRTGLIAFALFPVCVIVALKAPPFAILAIPYATHIFSDKLAWLHRWTARFIYILTCAHVAFWSVQLAKDRRVGINGGGIAWVYAFDYDKFIFGIIAFVCMTLLMGLSLASFRRSDFEMFFTLHIILIPLTLVFSALHFPPLSPFCYSALGLWGLERAWRLFRASRLNGGVLPDAKLPARVSGPFYPSQKERLDQVSQKPPPPAQEVAWNFQSRPSLDQNPFHDGHRLTTPEKVPLELSPPTKFREVIESSSPGASSTSRPQSPYSRSLSPPQIVLTPHHDNPQTRRSSIYNSHHDVNPHSDYIPPGCGRFILLPGRTMRLTVRMPRPMENCSPGQYAFLTIPLLSTWTSHPFTIACIREDTDPAQDLESGGKGKGRASSSQLLEFVIRARQGLTLDLWNHLHHAVHRASQSSTPTEDPLLLRIRVDGPYGSAARISWEEYATVLIVVGGSGVAFGLSILDRMCRLLSDENKRMVAERLSGSVDSQTCKAITGGVAPKAKPSRKKMHTTRVRLVWLVREYSHLAWCATALRRCLQKVPPNALQVDIFVTNFTPNPVKEPDLASLMTKPSPPPSTAGSQSSLAPPAPSYASHSGKKSRRSRSRSSIDSSDSGWSSDDSIADLSYTAQGHDTRRGRRAGSEPSKENEPHRYRTDRGTGYQGVYDDSDEEDLGDAGRHLVVELTNFEGEEDERDAGETMFSERVRKQGKHVRRKTMAQRDLAHSRHRAPAHASSSHQQPRPPLPVAATTHRRDESVTEDIVFANTSPPHSDSSTAGASTSGRPFSPVSARPTSPSYDPRHATGPPLGPPPISRVDPRMQALRFDTNVAVHSPLSPQHHSPLGTASPTVPSPRQGLRSPSPQPTVTYPPRPSSRTQQRGHQRRLSARLSIAESLYSQHEGPTSSMDMNMPESDTSSVFELMASSGQPTARGGALDYVGNLSPHEREDLGYIAAIARPGRPRIDKILSSEVERASGKLVVTCCGPGSLDAVVRKVTSSQIDPTRVRRGDMRGSITFYNEEFSF